jgi:Domain of unknown function (DUF3883)
MNLAKPTVAIPSEGTPRVWASWMKDQEAATADEYRRNPKRLLADHGTEKSIIRDYVGREILELLQNANDAAIEAEELGRIRIELHREGLVVANTGQPFSRDGVDSLRLAHLSPKRARRAQLVGHKGLGFRAVLNWARFPFILSGGLVLGYSLRYAREKQSWLRTLSSELAAAIDTETHLSRALVIPLLAFPSCPWDGNLAPFLETDAQRVLYARACELRTEYDTVIGMPFDEAAEALVEARAQIARLRPEVLLFAPGIQELLIVADGENAQHWSRISPDESGLSRVAMGPTGSATIREWYVRTERDTVPSEYLADGAEPQRYEIVLAVPANHVAEPGYLYSYFPTEVPFPYGLVAHASLDLVSNRQHFQPTKTNEFIVTRLAALLAETAAEQAARSGGTAGLEMLVTRGHHGEALEKMAFRQKLVCAARSLPLVPTLDGKFSIPADARRAPADDASWLLACAFPKVAKTQRAQMLGGLLEELGSQSLTRSDWMRAAQLLRFDTIDERAAFIGGVLEYRVRDAELLPLLLDSTSEVVPHGVRVFLTGPADRVHDVPKWMELRFLHPELHAALESRLGANDQAEMVTRLANLGVARYSLDSLLGALVARANQWAKEKAPNELAIRSELLLTLRELFPQNTAPEKRPRFPDDAKLLLPTQAGTFEDARTLYLGEGFGYRGLILQGLYGSFGRSKLLIRPNDLGLNDSPEQLRDFFRWLGVADLPRETINATPEWEFHQYVKQTLSFPLQMQDSFIPSAAAINEPRFKNLKTIDGLDRFLVKADPIAILAWLAQDDRAVRWKFSSIEHGQFGNRPHHAQYTRFYEGPIPSYIRWRLRTTAWLPRRDGSAGKPQDCVAESARGLEEVLPVPRRPAATQLQSFGLQPALLRDAFDRAGVIPGFSQLEPEQLYDLLLSLPLRDSSGRWARSIYRAVLDHFDASDVQGSAPRERFAQKGQMWARYGLEEKYWPVSDVWHVDSEDIPAALCRKLKVVTLPKRSGAQKVAAVFGVKAVERSNIVRRISEYQPVVGAERFSEEIEHLKPMIFLLRRTQRQAARESELFRKLHVIVCSSISGEVEFAGQSDRLELGAWDWILDDQMHTAYVQADSSEPDPLRSDLLADAMGQVFAAVFRIERGDEFARLISCKSKDRVKILHRLVGEDELPELAEIERRYVEAMQADEHQEFELPISALGAPAASTPASVPPSTLPPLPPSPPKLTDKPPFAITSREHVPSQMSPIECRVTRQTSAGPRSFSGTRRVTDWVFCERKVIEFEEHATPARFAVRVSNVTGWKAPGVDILSFNTADERQRFLASETKDSTLVARFIEVKGRSADAAKIDLRGNALVAAQTYRSRYFLYRVFDKGGHTYEIAVLRDPLGDVKGARAVVEVNLEAASGTEEFQIVGGLSETGQ